MKNILKAIWELTSLTTFTTRQTPNKLGLLSLLWQFCSYFFGLSGDARDVICKM